MIKDNFLSIKDELNMVKEELNSEEKFFEKAVMTEKFVKKYKKLMIGSVVAIVVLVGSNIIYTANQNAKVKEANKLSASLTKNAKDSDAILKLKDVSPSLYSVWLYSQAIANKDIKTLEELKNSKTMPLADLATYEIAQSSNDANALSDYALKQDAIFKDLAIIQSAILLMESSKIDKAHQELEQISEKSPLVQVAKALMHYGVK